MNSRGHYGDTRLAGVFERPVIADAIMALARRSQQLAWRWLAERGTPNAWLYTTSPDVSQEQIVAIEPENARQYLHYLMGSGKVGFWAIIELGASAPKIVDTGVADASVARLARSSLVADQVARERATTTAVRGYTGVGAQAPQPPPVEPERKPPPWWGRLLTNGLAIGLVGALGYAIYDLVKTHREFEKEDARDRRIMAAWSPSKREQYSASGLTVDAFEDWIKTGRGMTVDEWIRATPEKG